MGIPEELSRLRVEVARLHAKPWPRYPRELRQRILDWVDAAKASGMMFRECAQRLGVPQRQFNRWRAQLAAEQQPQPRALVRVELAEEVRAESVIAIVSPSGYRLEGITLDQAVALLRVLA